MQYASETAVSSEKSQAELRKVLAKYGATKFGYLEETTRAAIMFEVAGRRIRFVIPLPDRTDQEFTHTRHRQSYNRQRLSVDRQHERYEQAIRQRWRALVLAVKAKLAAVESGIATFEDEFLAYTMLPDGQTVGEWAHPQLEQAYLSGK